jgi:hypothetical protein
MQMTAIMLIIITLIDVRDKKEPCLASLRAMSARHGDPNGFHESWDFET